MSPSSRFFSSFDLNPLSEAIAKNTAVVVVGAGASIAAGLPSWGSLLENCLTFGRKKGRPVEQAAARFAQNDYLLAAELLSRLLGQDEMQDLICTFLRPLQGCIPSAIHHAVARLPFRAAITTNFDTLLEGAYGHIEHRLTWLNAEEVFKRTRAGEFFILKSHGDVARLGSLVLTRSHFRDQINDDTVFRETMRSLLLNNTVLFVGHSLRDLDLLHTMDELHLQFKTRFGPHFALLPADEIDPHVERHFLESYNILVKAFPVDEFPSMGRRESMTQSVTDLLTEVSGRVAEIQAENGINMKVDTRYFLSKACDDILRQTCDALGASHGTISLNLHRTVRRLQYVALRGKGWRIKPGQECSHRSQLGALFLRRSLDHDWIDIPDVTQPPEQPLNGGHAMGDFLADGIRSRLACPIYCDGHREGVISVESPMSSAFTRRHIDALNKLAQWVGIALYEARQRLLTVDLMSPYIRDLNRFLKLIGKSRIFADLELKVILYELNYIDGQMVAHSKEGGPAPFSHRFDGHSLAALVLERRTPEDVRDAAEDLQQDHPKLSREGVEQFKISGPVVAVPVRAQGYTASVLVAWAGKFHSQIWRYVPERLQRMANLVANDPWLSDPQSGITADRFLEAINAGLKPIDQGKVWSRELVEKKGSAIILVLLSALLSEAALQRVRLWRKVKLKPSTGIRDLFLLVYSGVRAADGNCQWDTEPLKATWSDDLYCQYTLQRYEHDPYARIQHRRMFDDIPDPNCELIGKAPDGYWTVAPIVGSPRVTKRNKTLMGYISADNHSWDSQNKVWIEQGVPPRVRNFQRCSIDIVTDLLHIVCSSPVVLAQDMWSNIQTKDGPLSQTSQARLVMETGTKTAGIG